jgi:hypothetical protein
MRIENAIADGVRRADLPVQEESHVIDLVTDEVLSLSCEDILRGLIDDLSRQEVQRRLDALS